MNTISTRELARLYTIGDDRTDGLQYNGTAGLWRRLVLAQYRELTRQTGVTVRFVSGQPFNHAEDMLNHIAETRDLPISTDFNESELNGTEGNLLFRAAHDLSHYLCDLEHKDAGVRCNFALDGETRAFARQARHLLALYDAQPYTRELEHMERMYDRRTIVQIAFSEVVLQAAVFYETGDFAAQKVVSVGIQTINRWLIQNGEPALPVAA